MSCRSACTVVSSIVVASAPSTGHTSATGTFNPKFESPVREHNLENALSMFVSTNMASTMVPLSVTLMLSGTPVVTRSAEHVYCGSKSAKAACAIIEIS